jgi:DNA-binding response OmpR family regulator
MTVDTTAAGSPHSDSIFPPGTIERHPTIPSATLARKVLVVEHDWALRNLIADVFAFEGYFVTEADDETILLGALSEAAHRHFDLIVLGIQMHGTLGIDALTRLRESGCRTPAIVLTELPKAAIAEEMNGLDARYLEKPFALEHLRVIANNMLHARKCSFGLLD